MPGELNGQVAIVTGGGRGIGRAVARALGAAGAAVAVASRTGVELAETAALVAGAGGRAIPIVADVTDRHAVEQMVEDAERAFGAVDLLVNNAGSAAAIGPIWEVDPDEWWRDVEINLRGTFLCARAVLARMVPRCRGRIVNVSSNLAVRPAPYTSGYAAAKAGVLRLTDGLAEATRAHGIAVFAISPGLVRTALTDHLAASPEGRRWVPQYASADFVSPDAAADLVAYLASGRADALSGRYFHVTDDVPSLVARAAEIQRDDLFTLRLRRG